MRGVLLAVALISFAGCDSERASEVKSVEQLSEPSYADVLQVYKIEADILDGLHDDVKEFDAMIERQLSNASSEEFEKIAADKIKYHSLMDEKIANQQERVDQAKADLEAARASRDQP